MAYKVIILLKRKDNLSKEEFSNWWLNEHSQHAKQLPGLRKLRFNLVADEDAAYDGVSELWFDSEADFNAAYETEIGKAVAADSMAHVSKRDRLLVAEHLIKSAA